MIGYPLNDGYSIFEAYFKDPTKSNEYSFIASWKRPKTYSYLNGIHSFIENFEPETGHYSRMVYFNNQKAFDDTGKEVKVTSSLFSYDETASEG